MRYHPVHTVFIVLVGTVKVAADFFSNRNDLQVCGAQVEIYLCRERVFKEYFSCICISGIYDCNTVYDLTAASYVCIFTWNIVACCGLLYETLLEGVDEVGVEDFGGESYGRRE